MFDVFYGGLDRALTNKALTDDQALAVVRFYALLARLRQANAK